jgi:hypothetical protein
MVYDPPEKIRANPALDVISIIPNRIVKHTYSLASQQLAECVVNEEPDI